MPPGGNTAAPGFVALRQHGVGELAAQGRHVAERFQVGRVQDRQVRHQAISITARVALTEKIGIGWKWRIDPWPRAAAARQTKVRISKPPWPASR